MFKNKDTTEEITSLLGEGAEFTGELSFTRGLRVDGVVRGKIRCDAALIVGPNGRVEADVTVHRICINGEFHGSIQASDRVEIHKQGKVYGEIYTPCLIIEAGAHFEGQCEMGERKSGKSEDAGVLKVVDASKEGGKQSSQAAGSEKSWLK